MATIAELLAGNDAIARGEVPNLLNNYINQYEQSPDVVNQFRTLLDSRNGILGETRDSILGAYDVFNQSTQPDFRRYIGESLSSGQKLLADIDKQSSMAKQFYGPQGQAQRLIDDYTLRYGNLLARQASANQALAKNQAMRSGASRSAQRASVAKQQDLDAQNLLKFQQQKVSDLSNIYNAYNQVISGLRNEAANTRQNFVINPLNAIYQRNATLAEQLVNNEANLANLRMQLAQSSGGGQQQTNTQGNQQVPYDSLLAYLDATRRTLDGTGAQYIQDPRTTQQNGVDISSLLK